MLNINYFLPFDAFPVGTKSSYESTLPIVPLIFSTEIRFYFFTTYIIWIEPKSTLATFRIDNFDSCFKEAVLLRELAIWVDVPGWQYWCSNFVINSPVVVECKCQFSSSQVEISRTPPPAFYRWNLNQLVWFIYTVNDACIFQQISHRNIRDGDQQHSTLICSILFC